MVTTGSRIVALVGELGIGKSNLTGALLRLGSGYSSDEALCLDRDTGDVVGSPLSPWSRAAIGESERWDPSEEALFTADDLGGSLTLSPGPVSDVLLEPPGTDGRSSRPRHGRRP